MRDHREPVEVSVNRRAFVLGVGGALVWSTLVARLVQLQVFEGATYRTLADENQFDLQIIPAPRGVIYDRFGHVVAANGQARRVMIVPDKIGDVGARLIAARTLAPTLGVDPDALALQIQAIPDDQFKSKSKRATSLTALATRLKLPGPALVSAFEPIYADAKATGWERVVQRVAEAIAVDPDQLKAKYKRERANVGASAPILIADDLSWEQYAAVNVFAPELPGVRPEVGVRRVYFTIEIPGGTVAPSADGGPPDPAVLRALERVSPLAHITGYVARANPKEAKDNPLLQHPSIRIGKSGVEVRCEERLRGVHGAKARIVSASGREVTPPQSSSIQEALEKQSFAPKSGDGVVLTIDLVLQQFATERMGHESASATLIDIETGELLVMASTPSFDPNLFVNGIAPKVFKELNTNDHRPLYHKCISGIYPPGSTFKMITALAALESGIVSPKDRVSCPGSYPFGGRVFHCWKRDGHGQVDLHNGIKLSCDCYFYDVARRIGPQRIADMARKFGFGEKYDIGIDGVKTGNVPDEAWALEQAAKKRRGPWNPGETLMYGIGQAALAVTPLQLAVMAARIANGGKAVTPTLFREGGPVKAPSPKSFKSIGVDPENLRRIQDGMIAVANEPGGTAVRPCQLDLVGMRMAGKTGTAQVRQITAAERATGVRNGDAIEWKLRDHALFVCFAPADAPRYAMSVVVDHGVAGSKFAAPIARDIMRKALLKDPGAFNPFTLASLTEVPTPPASEKT